MKDRFEYLFKELICKRCGESYLVLRSNNSIYCENCVTYCWDCDKECVDCDKLRKDGKRVNPIYNTFHGMRTRCYNSKHKFYYRYGGRGIKICDEWLNDFNAFVAWARLNGYRRGKTIDRINNDGDYEPSNCRFISRSNNSKKKDNS